MVCATKNDTVTDVVWNSTGRKGKTPPHTEVALTARKSANPQSAVLGWASCASLVIVACPGPYDVMYMQ